LNEIEQPSQILLKMMWKSQQHQQLPPSGFDDVQFRVYSQNGEDGILLYIFSLIGSTNKRFVEMCAGNCQQCNTANLVINHGWQGLMLDGDAEKVALGKEFYKRHPDTRIWPPAISQAWITRDNVNEIIRSHGIEGEVDLLSLDMDGNDYWILESLEVIQPRVIIAEYQSVWGPDKAVTQRYQEDFIWDISKRTGLPSCGASLLALVKLARRKGYRLVGCERKCFNALFIRNGIGEDIFPEIEVSECFSHPMISYNMGVLEERRDEIDENFWLEV
jgi:hypothetical protein